MNRKSLVGTVLVVLSSTLLFAQMSRGVLDTILMHNAYHVGEELVYEVKYGVVKGGEARLTVGVLPNGDSYVYHLKAVAVTTGFTAQFVTIEDVYESYIDIVTKLPVKAVRNIREQKYRRYNEILFDRERQQVISLKSGRHDVPKHVLDIVSAFYYSRSFLFKSVGQKDIIDLTTYFDEELLPVKIRFKKRQKIRTKFGRINALLFVPVIDGKGPFKSEDEMEFWLTDDANLIPIKVSAKLKVGSVHVSLKSFQNLRNDFQTVKGESIEAPKIDSLPSALVPDQLN